ncbi:MAG: nucleoside triphosphate pyrophosphohydrolase [Candidatus Sumerlaeota bacterium]|nr:nucleoside triphosphate pyrophosphohydrolase [Candidatus Sumerlaeota bacterium]
MTEPQITDSPYAIEDRFRRLVAIMARLRAPGGCPWDREQTHKTLTPYLIEEAYEVKETLDEEDFIALREELGDLALQIVFHAQLANEAGRFDIDGVLDAICEKLIRRHPHVFGEVTVSGSGEVLKNWEEIKKREKATKAAQGGGGKAHAPDVAPSILGGVPPSLPALLKAHRIQEKVAHVGFDWTTVEPIFDKIHEEIEELREALQEAGIRGQGSGGEEEGSGVRGQGSGSREEGKDSKGTDASVASQSTIGNPQSSIVNRQSSIVNSQSAITDPLARARVAGEIGDLLFSIVNLSRRLGVPAEEALDMTNRKFMARFRRIEQRLHALGKRPADMTLEQLDAMWDEVKREE